MRSAGIDGFEPWVGELVFVPAAVVRYLKLYNFNVDIDFSRGSKPNALGKPSLPPELR